MKKLLTIFSLLFYVSSFATIHYIDPSGNDATGTGTSGSPWYSISHAVTVVTTSGDIIHVNPGTYTDSIQGTLPNGVSIEGLDTSSVIYNVKYVGHNGFYNYGRDAFLVLTSATENTNGNQHISGIAFKGMSLTANVCISVSDVGNVAIYNCTFDDFASAAVNFIGAFGAAPTVTTTGNIMYNCSVRNCSDRNNSPGAILISGEDITIHDCYLNQTQRASGHNGDNLSAVNGYSKIRFYNNYSVKPLNESNWNFHCEIWLLTGGSYFHDNTFIGGGQCIDVGAGAVKGSYAYSIKVLHNNFLLSAQASAYINYSSIGINFEDGTQDAIADSNYFSTTTGVLITYTGTSTLIPTKNITISHNEMHNLGYANNDCCTAGVQISVSGANDTIRNVMIYNNDMSGNTGTSNPYHIIAIDNSSSTGLIVGVHAINNIIRYTTGEGYLSFVAGTYLIDSIDSKNNMVYNNANSNAPYYGAGRTTSNVTHFTNTGNIIADPLYISTSDYHLQATSSAINAGLNVGFPYDGTAPDIGAYEYITNQIYQTIYYKGLLLPK